MRKSKYFYLLFASFLAIALTLGACGGGDEPSEAAAEPAAQTEAVVEEAPAPTEAPTEEAAPAEAEAAPAEVDLVAMVDEYMANIPEGYMAVGNLDTVKEIIEAGETVLIDVREPSEYESGHIPGAVNVPIRTLAENLDKVPTDKPVLLYCASGYRAALATSALRSLGYDNVRAYPPSWKGWSAAGEPVEMEAVEGETYDVPEIPQELFAAVNDYLTTIPEGYHSLGTVEKLEDAMDAGAFLIDVREPGEFEEGAITGAVNIPIRSVPAALDQIPEDQQVVVYCASGFRAALTNAALHILGYDNVRAFPPGYGTWEAAQGEAGEVPAEVEAAVESDFEIVSAVDEYMSNIPEGYMAVGNIDDFKDMLDATDVYLIDVREPSEYEAGHIEGAVNIPIRSIPENLDQIPTDQPVMVYCASGHRAAIATSALRMLGYDNVKAFPPGWKGWSAAEEPVSTEATEAGAFDVPEIDPEMMAAVSEFVTNIPEGFLAIGDPEKVSAAIDAGAAVIDVREEDEYARGHIAGAVSIPMRSLAQNLDQIPEDVPVIVYCASGHRAALSLAALQAMGFTNARSFPAGYGAWEAAGGVTE